MRASRVPLNAGAWVPEPSAARTPLAVAGMPLERRIRCMDVAASALALADASCSAAVSFLTPACLSPPLQAVGRCGDAARAQDQVHGRRGVSLGLGRRQLLGRGQLLDSGLLVPATAGR